MLDKFNFHADYFEAGKALSKKERIALWDALLMYAFDGTEPDIKGAAKAVFIALKGRVDASVRGVENAKRGKGAEEAPEGDKGASATKAPSEAPCEGATEAPTKAPGKAKARKNAQPLGTVLEYRSTRVQEGVDDEGLEGSYPPTPTCDEVRAYFGASCLRGDPEAFFDFYEGQGWRKSNGMPVGDWRAVARSWGRRQVEIDAERAAKGEPTADQAAFRPVKSDEERLAELEAELAAKGWA